MDEHPYDCSEMPVREAAPELLAALKQTTVTLRGMLDRLSAPADDRQRAAVTYVQGVIACGDAAIAKAEGR